MSRFRFWAAEALSGDIVGEFQIAGSSSWSCRFGGGSFSANVSVSHLLTRNRSAPDWQAVERVMGWCTGGKFTVVVSQGLRTVGEWLIFSHEPTTADGTVPIAGFEWDGYPAFRSLNSVYKYDDVEQLTIAKDLLTDVFLSFQGELNMDIPTPAASGVKRDLDYKNQSAYYGDLLDEISSPDDGFDWRVKPSLVWENGAPVRVDRQVQFGYPYLQRTTDLVVQHDGPGKRSGNCVDFSQGYDFARAAQSVYGIGAGEGSKRLIVGLTDTTLSNQGYLATTKHVSFPSVKKVSTLTNLTRGELAAAQDLRDPMRARLVIDRLPNWPQVGDRVGLEVARTWAFPDGVTGTARLGEVSLNIDGHHTSSVSVQAL